jgi:hypothetical protein
VRRDRLLGRGTGQPTGGILRSGLWKSFRGDPTTQNAPGGAAALQAYWQSASFRVDTRLVPLKVHPGNLREDTGFLYRVL